MISFLPEVKRAGKSSMKTGNPSAAFPNELLMENEPNQLIEALPFDSRLQEEG